MTAKILDGRAAAKKVKGRVAKAVQERKEKGLSIPGLEVILVGEDPASATYVRHKQKACKEAGIRSHVHLLPESTQQKEIEDLIDQCNADSQVHGILLQLPLPDRINPDELVERIREAIELCLEVEGERPEPLDFVGVQKVTVAL